MRETHDLLQCVLLGNLWPLEQWAWTEPLDVNVAGCRMRSPGSCATSVAAERHYLSSSRKRLAPQLMFKGGIFNTWGKKIAVAVQRSFFSTLPELPRVSRDQGEIAWMIYDLEYNPTENRYQFVLSETVYSRFKSALAEIITPTPGPIERFVQTLERRMKKGEFLGTAPESEVPPDTEPPPDPIE